MKAKKPTLTPFKSKNHPEFKWRVRYSQEGRRKDKIFRTKSEAKKFLVDKEVEFANLGSEYSDTLTDQLRREAVEAHKKLSEAGATIPEAVEFFLKSLGARRRSKEIGEAIEEWLTLKEKDSGIRPRTLQNLRSRSRYLAERFRGRLVAEVSEADIVQWLEGIGGTAQTVKHYRSVSGGFFEWSRLRGYCESNPVRSTPVPKVTLSDPEIFTPGQMRTMLEKASASGNGQLVAWLVLGGFAGLRSQELQRLRWEHVDFEHGEIDIGPGVAKTGAGRTVTLEQNAAEWLLTVRKSSGQILANDWFVKTAVKDLKASLNFEWKHNGLRHSFASYHLYRHENAGRTALILGHEGAPAMLFRHYRRRVRKDVAEQWFSIFPEDSGSKIQKIG